MHHRPTFANTTALILAGGEGKRLGGRDKGWVDFNGLPLVEHAIRNARAQCKDVRISANRNLARYRSLEVEVVRDVTLGYQGPIAGILAGALRCETPWLWILPVDAPHCDSRLLPRLFEAIECNERNLAVVHDGTRIQPLFTLLNRRAQATLLNYYLAGGRSIRRWLAEQDHAIARCDDFIKGFLNVNEVAQLASTSSVAESTGR